MSSSTFTSITFKKISSGSEKSSKTAVLALKSPTSAHFMSFSNQVLLDNNISLKRYTQCECRPNNFGGKLLEMCKSALAIFEKYCHHWKLKVNLQKTQVIIKYLNLI
jgi:hypothetical protein